jgi:hypothetical protein
MYRFTLKRVANQHPIRYQAEEKRPTEQELVEYRKIRDLLGLLEGHRMSGQCIYIYIFHAMRMRLEQEEEV